LWKEVGHPLGAFCFLLNDSVFIATSGIATSISFFLMFARGSAPLMLAPVPSQEAPED
jgi:hypothetical protein